MFCTQVGQFKCGLHSVSGFSQDKKCEKQKKEGSNAILVFVYWQNMFLLAKIMATQSIKGL